MSIPHPPVYDSTLAFFHGWKAILSISFGTLSFLDDSRKKLKAREASQFLGKGVRSENRYLLGFLYIGILGVSILLHRRREKSSFDVED